MAKIRNRLNQRIVINLKSGKNLNLFAKGVSDVLDSDLGSPHLQTILARGDITVIPGEGIPPKKKKNVTEKEDETIDKKWYSRKRDLKSK